MDDFKKAKARLVSGWDIDVKCVGYRRNFTTWAKRKANRVARKKLRARMLKELEEK